MPYWFRALNFCELCQLNSSCFFDSQLTTVVTAFAAYCVVNMPCTAVGANGQCGGYSLVVSSSLGCSCL